MRVEFETRDGVEFAMWTNDNGDGGSARVDGLKADAPATWALFKKAYDEWKKPPKPKAAAAEAKPAPAKKAAPRKKR